jgi:antitoxin ParD1/3/4
MPSSFTHSAHLQSLVRQEVDEAERATVSAVTRDDAQSIKQQDSVHQARLDTLRAEIDHGVDSGPGIPGSRVLSKVREQIVENERFKNA